MLGYLLSQHDRPVTIDRLVDRVYGEVPPATARNQVKTAVYQLRRRLGESVVHTRNGGYELRVEPPDTLDLKLLDELDPGEALALWRGTPLSDVEAPFVASLRRDLLERKLAVIDRLDDRAAHLSMIRELTEEHPLRESAWRHLIGALAQSGQVDAALETYQHARRVLIDELGMEPGPELVEEHRAVLSRGTRPRGSHQLFGDIAEFTGRTREIARIVDLLKPAGGRAIRAVAIEGMAGVGKTRLAVHVAHQLADAFPDGRFAVDLGGFREQGVPEDPLSVLEQLLTAMGEPRGSLPASLEARAARYRQRLAGRRVLVVLDNAADEAQVTPLLPGDVDSAVLITSRRGLALDGAHRLPLGELPDDDAEELFARITGRDEDSSELVALCGNLPLAVALVAHRLVNRPQWTVAGMAARLRRETSIHAGTRRVWTVFESSYRELDAAQARAFRLLGLHPGTRIGRESAAVLLGADAERLLDQLVDLYLLTPAGDDSYRMHDLLRAFAASLAHDHGEDLGRWLDWYVRAAYRAASAVDLHVSTAELGGDADTPALDYDDAMAWLAAENHTIVEAARLAWRHGFDEAAWRLPLTLLSWWGSPRLRTGWDEIMDNALEAARRRGDRRAESRIMRIIGLNENNVDLLLDSIEISRTIHHTVGEGCGYHNLGTVHGKAGRYREAVQALEKALTLYGPNDDDFRRASMNNLGLAYTGLGEHDRALSLLHQVLRLAERQGGDFDIAGAHSNIGETYLALARYAEATEHLTTASDLYIKHGENYSITSMVLGDALFGLGRTAEAEQLWRETLASLDDADPDYPSIAAKLRDKLTNPRIDAPRC